ncbi:hypothetical protein [Moraxella lacunata]|uniref:hypothetical protein n=1 Tax=Moraxella lacunata TaxID=477 RepID=UPI003EDF1AFF
MVTILLSYLSKFLGNFGKNNLPQIIADIPPIEPRLNKVYIICQNSSGKFIQ